MIERVRKLNEDKGYVVAIMMDTEGSEIHRVPIVVEDHTLSGIFGGGGVPPESRASSRMVRIHNSVKSSLITHSGSSKESKIENEGAPQLRDGSAVGEIASEEKNKADGNVNRVVNNSTVTGRIFVTPKTCSVPVLDSSSGADMAWEQAVNHVKSTSLCVANNRIHPMSSTVVASKLSHLVGLRSQSNIQARRDVSPASKNDGVLILSQGLSPSGVGSKPSCAAGVSLHVGRVGILSPKGKVKPDNFSSSLALSDGKESGDREEETIVKGTDTGVAPDYASLKAAVCLNPAHKRHAFLKGGSGDSVEALGKMSSEKYRSISAHHPSKKQMIQKISTHAGKVVNSGCLDYAGQSADDHEELLVAANSARNASYRACSNLFWKKMECYFAPVSPQDESYLKNQLDFADALNGSLYRRPENENSYLDDLKLQQYPVYSGGRKESPKDQGSIEIAGLTGSSGITETLDEAPSLYGRVLSALIDEEESKDMSLQNYKKHDFQCGCDDSHCGSCNYNGIEAENKNRMTTNNFTCKLNGRNLEREVDLQVCKQGFFGKNSYDNCVSWNTDSNQSVSSSVCNTEHWQADDGLSDYAGFVPWISHSDLVSSMESDTSPVSTLTRNYHMLSVKDKLRLELQNIDLCPEMHHIAAGQYTIDQEIFGLQAELIQKVQKRKKSLLKIYEAIQYAKEAEKRNLEQVALSILTEMAYKNQMVSHGGALRKFSKKVALPFAERTLSRWRKFEDTGNEADLQNVFFSTPTFNSNPNTVDENANRKPNRLSNHNWQPRSSGSLAKEHLGMDLEVLLNDVSSNASSKAISVGNAKEKRSERANDDSEKYIPKKFVRRIGRPPVGSSVDVLPSTLKPKVKAHYLVASNDEPESIYMESKHAASRSPHASPQSMGVVSEDMREKKQQSNVEKGKSRVNPSAAKLTEVGSFENQDFNTLLDIEVEGMKDQVMQGLDVPMDDLKDVYLYI